MYILIKIHIFCMFGFSGRVCNFSGSGRVGFVIFFSGSGRVRVSKKPSGRVGFSGTRPITNLAKDIIARDRGTGVAGMGIALATRKF